MTWYSWGSGGSGCLLLPNLDDFSTPQASSSSGLHCLVCGGCHCLSVNDDGNVVYAWGDNKFGQCVQDPEQRLIQVPTPVHLPDKVLMVACGWRHSLFLFQDGRIGSCGHKSVIGRSIDLAPAHAVEYIDIRSRIVTIACGYEHSAAIDSESSLWCWGSNKFGQIGIPAKEKRIDQPTTTNFPKEFVPRVVVCGLRHTAVLTNDGKVLMVGSNRYGQLGRKEGFEMSLGFHDWRPVDIQENVKFLAFSSGWFHMLALSDANEVWTWGRGDLGQQGDGNLQHRPEPHLVSLPDKIADIFCGSEHSVCINSSKSTAFMFGWNEHGNLGLGDELNRSIPTPVAIENRTITRFATGGAVCFAYATYNSNNNAY